MFTSRPRIQSLHIAGRHACHVIDDALLDPDALVEHAARHSGDFVEAPHNAYPGPELRMPDAFSAQLDAFFSMHLRDRFAVRRTERMYSRLSLTTTPADRLRPAQSLCHVDRLSVSPAHRIVASVQAFVRVNEFVNGLSRFAAHGHQFFGGSKRKRCIGLFLARAV